MFLIKNCIHKGRPSYRGSLPPSKHEFSDLFFYFCGSFLPSWIRIRNTGRNVYPGDAKELLQQRIPHSRKILEMRTITQELRTILGAVQVDDPWKCGRLQSGAAEETLAPRTITVRPQTIK